MFDAAEALNLSGLFKKRKVVEGIPDWNVVLVGSLTDEEKLQFPGLATKLSSINLKDVTIESLFDIGGFSYGATVNSVIYNGGSYLSAFSKDQKKASATRMLKSKEGPVSLDNLYGSPKERKDKTEKAKKKAKQRGANVNGPADRIPVAEKRCCIHETRFVKNMEKLHKKQEETVEKEKNQQGKRTRDRKAAKTNVFFRATVEDDPNPAPPNVDGQRVQFVVKLQSNEYFWEHAELLLEWLKKHPLVVLDPGKRWVVRGIIARFVQGTIEDGSVHLSFVYRGLRVSGRQWNTYREGIGVPVADVQQELQQSIQSAVDRLATKEFLCAADQVDKLQSMFSEDSFPAQIEQSCQKLLDGRAVRRKEFFLDGRAMGI